MSMRIDHVEIVTNQPDRVVPFYTGVKNLAAATPFSGRDIPRATIAINFQLTTQDKLASPA
jgi:hypothetical protein